MNPPLPFPNGPNPASFTFLPQNPISNPNPNPSFISPASLPPSPTISASAPDLPTALSSLKDLIDLSEATLSSLDPALLRYPSSSLCPCPFNPHHRLPSEFLFRHSLRCPFPSPSFDPSLLDSLQYPKTLKPELNRFVPSSSDSSSELCFALDGYADFASNFFYRDCPGVVCSSDQDGSGGAKRTFTLPAVLLAECANLAEEFNEIGAEAVRLLPSELWAVRGEIEVWNDYPGIYSYFVLQVILQSRMIKESDSLTWVIANSPPYGIVIDAPMRDHIFLLFRLCLGAIIREAIGLEEMLMNGELKGQDLELGVKIMNFKCPILLEVCMWLASQLSVLYGELNARLLVIEMLKQWLLNAASELLLFSAENYVTGCLDAENALEKDQESKQGSAISECSVGGEIFVSQIAAAIAALHERALLEEKIRGLQLLQPSTSYQRMAEHASFSKRADEERQNRSNYRPVIEHDGLLLHRLKNQEISKNKTREELLAEERDFKRRRMSYRGKKLKRTTTQVIRNIIEEYMEEIKLVGGIGSSADAAKKLGTITNEEFSSDATTYSGIPRQPVCDSSAAYTHHEHGDRRQSDLDYHVKATRFDDDSTKDLSKRKSNSQGHDRHLENSRSMGRDRRDTDYYSRSHEQLHESVDLQTKRNDREITRSKNRDMDRASSHYHDSRSYSSSSYSVSNSDIGRGNRKLEMKDRHRRRRHGSRSHAMIENSFDDRYDPSRSLDTYEDDVSTGYE